MNQEETINTVTEDDIEFFRQQMLRETNHKARKRYEKQYQLLVKSLGTSEEVNKSLQNF